MPTPEETIVARLRHVFSAADCQTLMVVLMGTTCQPAELPELVAAAINNSASFVRTRVAKHVTVNFTALLTKLRNETPHNLAVLQKYIKAACNIETDYLVDDVGVPCIHALRRVGLVAPSGPTAWGFAVVRTKDYVADEWLLRDDPNDVPTVQGSLEKLCRQLVKLTHQMRGGKAPADFSGQMMHRLYTVMKLTEWYNFRVEEDDGGRVSIVEIKTQDLFDDICRRDMGDLTIQGVNAPPFAC